MSSPAGQKAGQLSENLTGFRKSDDDLVRKSDFRQNGQPVVKEPAAVDPATLVEKTAAWLATTGNPVDAETVNSTNAYIAAATLMLCLGAKVAPAADDQSPAANAVRQILLEDSVRTTTRSRRAV